MKNENTTTRSAPAEKPGFLKRLVDKLDSSLKQKAEEKSNQTCCGGSGVSKGKGGKCC
ncbi:MAG: hypothetical protein R3F07_08315 [Opitutaceae bacterium]